MKLRAHGTFNGGVDLPEPSPDGRKAPIEASAPPTKLLVPCHRPADPAVDVGQVVVAGETIASARDEGGLDIFAPLGGTVSAIGTTHVCSGDELLTVPAIELTDLSAPRGLSHHEETFDWRRADDREIAQRLNDGALPTFARTVEPLACWLDRVRGARCEAVVANVMENEPYFSAGHRLLVEHGRGVVFGLEILRRAAGLARAAIAVDHRRTGSYRRTAVSARDVGIDRIALTHKYPVGNDRVLAKVLTGRMPPPDGTALARGLAVTDASTCHAVYRWVACGRRATHRVVAVASAGGQGNVWTPFGAPCAELAPGEGDLVHGGAMTGLVCDVPAVVTAGTRALGRLGSDGPGLATACVRCAWCVDRCPAGLNVPALNDAFELGQFDACHAREARRCIGCGICSYVCPSCLPLMARVKRLKRAASGEGGRR